MSLLPPAYRRNGEGYVLTPVCLSTWGTDGGTPISGRGVLLSQDGENPSQFRMGVPLQSELDGVPTPHKDWIGGDPPNRDRMRITPVTWTVWGNTPTLHLDWIGVHPHPIRTGWGNPPVRTEWEYPHQDKIGVPRPHQDWMGVHPQPRETEQHSEYLLRGGRHASCVHAEGLSCYI